MARRLTPFEKKCRAMTEEQLSEAVVEYAEREGWLVFFIPDWIWRLVFASMKRRRRGDRRWAKPGYPDLTMVKDGRLVIVELKSEKGEAREVQQRWLDELARVPGIEVYLWKPSHWLSGVVDRILSPEA